MKVGCIAVALIFPRLRKHHCQRNRTLLLTFVERFVRERQIRLLLQLDQRNDVGSKNDLGAP